MIIHPLVLEKYMTGTHSFKITSCQLVLLTLLGFILQGCSFFELFQEPYELIGSAKANHKIIYLHDNDRFIGETATLAHELRNAGYTVHVRGDFSVNPNRPEDSELLAGLRSEAGVIGLWPGNFDLSSRESRALELFVHFGGRLVIFPVHQNFSQKKLIEKFGLRTQSTSGEAPFLIPPTEQRPLQKLSPFIKITHGNFQNRLTPSPNNESFQNIAFRFPLEVLAVTNPPENINLSVIATTAGNQAQPIAQQAEPPLFVVAEPKAKIKGKLIVVGDKEFARVAHNSNQITNFSYTGGLLTRDNCKFAINLFGGDSDNESCNDNEGPTLGDVTLTPGEQEVRPGVGRIQINIRNTQDSWGVGRFFVRSRNNQRTTEDFISGFEGGNLLHATSKRSGQIFFKESDLVPNLNSDNVLEVCAEDLNHNVSCLARSVSYLTLNSTSKALLMRSTLPGDGPEEGVDLFGTSLSYPNERLFNPPQRPLSTSLWNSGSSQCEEFSALQLLALTQAASMDGSAAAHAFQLQNLPILASALDANNFRPEDLQIAFTTASLEGSPLIGEDTELRNYSSLEPTPTTVTILLAGEPILRGFISTVRIILDHNAPENCNDDVISGQNALPSALIPITSVPANKLAVATAFLQEGTRIKFGFIVFDRILHRPTRTLDGSRSGIRYHLGVHHPDQGAVNLMGHFQVDIVP